MLVLAIRSDNPQAELYLWEDGQVVNGCLWQAHRQLAETIHQKIASLLDESHKKLSGLQGIIAYQGPGSFTGLRIGLTVANTLAYALHVPVAGASGDSWLDTAASQLTTTRILGAVMPEYGAEAHITLPKS